MAVCSFCARLAEKEFLEPAESYATVHHHPSLQSLLESSLTCELCRFFVEQCGAEGIDKIKRHADAGHWTRAVVRSRDEERPERALGGCTVRHFLLASRLGQTVTREFLLANSKGKTRRPGTDRAQF
jgi:hypothetical protein